MTLFKSTFITHADIPSLKWKKSGDEVKSCSRLAASQVTPSPSHTVFSVREKPNSSGKQVGVRHLASYQTWGVKVTYQSSSDPPKSVPTSTRSPSPL